MCLYIYYFVAFLCLQIFQKTQEVIHENMFVEMDMDEDELLGMGQMSLGGKCDDL